MPNNNNNSLLIPRAGNILGPEDFTEWNEDEMLGGGNGVDNSHGDNDHGRDHHVNQNGGSDNHEKDYNNT